MAGTREEEQMADSYDRYESEGGGPGFVMGLLTGTVLGAGIGILLAPKAGADLRGQIGEQARNFSNMASDQYKRAGEAATGWAERGRGFVDRAREAVSRGAEEARNYAGGAGNYGSGPTGGSYGGASGTNYGSGSNSGNTGSG